MMTIVMGVLALLFSPALLIVALFLLGVAVIVLCPDARAMLRPVANSTGRTGCNDCQSYACPILIAIVFVGFPLVVIGVRFLLRRLSVG